MAERRKLLDLDLRGLIAGILSRPYRAARAPVTAAAAVIDEVPRATLRAEIGRASCRERVCLGV